uniref:SRCR domain-containing protein n=1 Tax=Magallana gigas TaxID=29159 RepID=A0A8W8MJW7_MAGGI
MACTCANKTCGAVTCNSYSKCVRSAFGNSVCIPVVILQVRLVNGSHSGEGRVEVLYNNVWGTVCDDIWNTNNAQVVCRMLGYEKSAIATTSAYFGQGNGQIWMDDVNCIGNETMLTDCQFLGFGIHNCVHAEDAVTLQVRLVNGSLDEEGRVEGRLEVLLNNVWGTVCDDIWNTNNAQVVCRMLGYDGSAEATANAYFGKGVGQIWMDDVSCNGNEQSLTGCPFS